MYLGTAFIPHWENKNGEQNKDSKDPPYLRKTGWLAYFVERISDGITLSGKPHSYQILTYYWKFDILVVCAKQENTTKAAGINNPPQR